MGRITVGVNVRGFPAVRAAYEDFGDQYINRLVKTGAQKAGRKTVRPVKSLTKPGHRTGRLEMARGMKSKSYRRSKVWVVLVGARHGFRTNLPFWGNVDPTKYDHLYEGGRKAVKAGQKTVKRGVMISGRRVRINAKVATNAQVLAIKIKVPKAKRSDLQIDPKLYDTDSSIDPEEAELLSELNQTRPRNRADCVNSARPCAPSTSASEALAPSHVRSSQVPRRRSFSGSSSITLDSQPRRLSRRSASSTGIDRRSRRLYAPMRIARSSGERARSAVSHTRNLLAAPRLSRFAGSGECIDPSII